MTLTYQQALAALESRGRFGVRLGLSRMHALLAALDHPERSFRGALIAGTNGKGSVLALTAAALAAAGYRTGETPKPHLVTYRERLQLAGRPVDRATFARLVADVLPVADAVARRHGEPTEFELLTAITFRWFAEVGVDLALVEVGLGGRLDATHAWDGGVAVVTNVSLDHTDRLGSTVEAIAREKAAIIGRHDVAVTGAAGGALEVVRRRARRVGAPLTVVPPPALLSLDRDGIEVDLGRLGPTRVGLRGRHQAANAALADATLDALEIAGLAVVGPADRRSGYAVARWPGRLELVETAGRQFLLDGAHNPAGAAVLAEALDDLEPYLSAGRPAIVLAAMADKDVDGIVAGIAAARLARQASVVCTAPPAMRALEPARLAERWTAVTGRPAVAVDGLAAALDEAASSSTGAIVVCGSLYLVGAARARLVRDERLMPDEPSPPGGPERLDTAGDAPVGP